MEVLTAYVRKNAPRFPKEPAKGTTTPNEGAEQKEDGEQDKDDKQDETSSPQEPPADIKAILDVLRRREVGRVPEASRIQLDLRRTDLGGANLEEANLEGAALRGADLTRALGLTQEQLEQAVGDETTELTERLTMPVPWTNRANEQTDGDE